MVYGETHLFVGSNFLVSVRHGASSSFAMVQQRCDDGTKALHKGTGFTLYAVPDFVADGPFIGESVGTVSSPIGSSLAGDHPALGNSGKTRARTAP